MKKIKGSPAVAITLLFSMMFLAVGPLTVNNAKVHTASSKASAKAKSSALARYAIDMTRLARQGKLEHVSDHAAEIQRARQILSHTQRNNPVLVGDSNFEAKTVVEGLAQRIVAGDVPQNLRQAKRRPSWQARRLSCSRPIRGLRQTWSR